ncbi:MAG: hypothetical protein IIC67_05705, partial [Thaumarchaeota archaeon]|nr:hypothetical protein [Nitrososphaerota archaeon]
MSKGKILCRNKKCQRKIDPANDFLCPYCGEQPIEITLLPSFKETIDNTVKLNQKILGLQTYVTSLGFDVKDARSQFLGVNHTLLMLLNIELGVHLEGTKDLNDVIPQKLKHDVPGITPDHLRDYLGQFEQWKRVSFLTMWMFRVEILLNEIKNILPDKPAKESKFGKFARYVLRKLGIKQDNTAKYFGYKALVRHVLRELEMTSLDNEWFRILYFPAIMRNCMHSNGLYKENTTNGKIDGIQFTFKKGEDVKYAAWRNIYFFCDKILDAIKEIFEN